MRPWRGPGRRGLGTGEANLAAVAVFGLVGALFVAALVDFHAFHWAPGLDDALTEIRVRSVATLHPPWIGLPGRIFASGHLGSHPGPLSFYVLWPVYRLFGESAFGLRVATASVHLVAIGLALWLLTRRNIGVGRIIEFGVGLTAMVAFFSALVLTKPWNPYLPIFWWVTFLVAAWSTLDHDRFGPVVAVIAGSFCMQTHISYVGLVPGVAVVTIAALALDSRRSGADRRRLPRHALLIAVAVGLGLWVPPFVDQLTRSPGNLTTLYRYFSSPPEAVLGVSRGLSLLLAHLNPWSLASQRFGVAFASMVPGALVVAAWMAGVVRSVRLHHTVLVRLHVVLAAALVFGVASAARIFGVVFFYLDLWSWGLLVLLVLATVWSWADAFPSPSRPVAILGVVGCVVVAAVFSVQYLGAAARASTDDLDSRTVRSLSRQTDRALDQPDRRDDGPYVLDWTDPVRLGASGYGLLNEMIRAGRPVGASAGYAQFIPRQYLERAGQSRARIHLAVGADVTKWAHTPGAVRVATFDDRTPFQRQLFADYRRAALATLRAAGLERLNSLLDDDTFGAQTDTRLPAAVRAAAVKMSALGEQTAVFLIPLE